MPTREQVRQLVGENLGCERAARELVNPPHPNPTGTDVVREWIAAGVAADGQMSAAAALRTAEREA